MNNIEFFLLNFRNVMIFANTSTTFFFKTDVFNFSMIDAIKIDFFSIINIVTFFEINTTEIKKNFKYIVLMFFSKINEIFYF